MSSTSVKNYSLTAVVLILACLVTGYLLLKSFLPKLQQSQATLVRTQATNADLKKALASEKTFLKNFESQQENVALANLILPSGSADMPNFITNLSSLATASGVSLANFSVSDPAGTQKTTQPMSIQTQDLGFSSSGSYLALKDFILRLESSSRIVDITRFVLAASDKTEINNTTLQYQVKLHTFYQQ